MFSLVSRLIQLAGIEQRLAYIKGIIFLAIVLLLCIRDFAPRTPNEFGMVRGTC